eukprot:TRINITY_DN3596_c0_g1_i3.p1 TRINITY_DN3596_c0_g1~~TRINITY_DN3596_c0_g1_i3.p1  ORF type:complete len:714 (+),score=163.82 TRINITY_DN3596_c0_g1_i3:188-2329(+)
MCIRDRVSTQSTGKWGLSQMGCVWLAVLVMAMLQPPAAGTTTYPLDFTLVDTTTTSPASSSKQAGATLCSCDLSDGKCDVDCCCDTDCSTEEKSNLFSCCCDATCDSYQDGPGGYVESKPAHLWVYRCCCAVGRAGRPSNCATSWYRDNAVQALGSAMCPSSTTYNGYTNTPGYDQSCDNVARNSDPFLRDVVCVEEAHTSYHEDSLVYYDTVETGTIYDGTVPTDAGFGGISQLIQTPPQFPQYTLTTTYKVGDPILAAYVTTSTAVASASNVNFMNLFVPAGGMGGDCDNRRTVQFGVDVDESCLLEVTPLSTVCTAATSSLTTSSFTSLDAFSYGAMLHVADSPDTVPGSSTGWVQSYLRAASGITSYTYYASASTSSVSTDILQPSYTSGTKTCKNVLRNLTYHITYGSASGVITDVRASVEVISMVEGTDQELVIPQRFSVRWYKSGGTPAQARELPGSPGYIPGNQIVVGYQTTSSSLTANAQFVRGAEIPAAGASGACSIYHKTPILYDTPVKTQCTITVANAAALQTYCESIAAGSLPAFLAYNFTHIGLMGVAEPRYTNNWTALTAASSLPTAAWLSSVSTCSSLVTGVEFDFVIADLGEQVSPQGAVLAAQVSYVTGSWTYSSLEALNGEQTFTHSVAVRYHKYNNGIYDRVGKLRPAKTTFPDDIMHPFYPFSGSQRSQISGLKVMVVSGVVALLTMAGGML